MNGPHVVLIRRGIQVSIADVGDPALKRAIESSARQTLRHLSGKWDVKLRRTSTRPEWDLRLRGASGLHVATFSTAATHLPARVAEKLRGFLAYARESGRHGSEPAA